MEEEDDADHAHRNRELDDLFLERIDRSLDQIGPVVGRDDLDPLGKGRRDVVRDLFLDPFDDIEDVLAEPDDDDAAGDFALAVEFRNTPPDLGAELDLGDVPQIDGRAGPVRADGDSSRSLIFLM